MENKLVKITLDEETQKAVNSLSLEEAIGRNSYAFDHELLWYGIDSVAHIHLLETLKSNIKLGVPKEDFINKYELEFGNKKWGLSDKDIGFIVRLKKIESDGIFIPRQAYIDKKEKERDRKVWFFNNDYHNIFLSNPHKYSSSLIKKWQLSDLENLELIEKGIQFGKDMWKECVKGFEQYKDCEKVIESYPRTPFPFINQFLPNKGIVRITKRRIQPPNVTELGERLIKYYSSLIESYNSNKCNLSPSQ